jgi:hypothetical protein
VGHMEKEAILETLKLEYPMMHGPAVRRLQELLDVMGHDRGPNDGIFGEDTKRAVELAQFDLGLKVDGICGPRTWAGVLERLDKGHEVKPPGEITDIRGQHARPKLYGRQRDWTAIHGVTLHQTGCNMPQNPEKWRRLNAHIGITTEGRVVLVNDPCDMIWHGQGLSQRTIGIEIEGNFEGIKGNQKTLWEGGGPAATLTDAQIAAAGVVFRWLDARFDENGATWSKVHAHRQSSRTRAGDPGSEIWQRIAIPWIIQLYATDGGPSWCTGSGRPIPKDWDGRYPGKYWG